jgi:MFS family permease
LFALTLAVITYIDRVCMSQAAPHIQEELGLNKDQMAIVFAAFTLAYGLFEIPGGWLGDWIGPRKVLMRVVTMWSIFTAATGWAWNMASLVVYRFLFGAGEAGCFPNLTKAFTIWLPPEERVRAQGITWFSARWGGAFTPVLVVAVFALVSWRWGFVVFGAIGVVWAVFFYVWFRDDPRQHPAVNAAELALIQTGQTDLVGHGNVPWLRFLGSPSVWLLWLQYACLAYPWYFYITWLPTYLKEARGVALMQSHWAVQLKDAMGGWFDPALVDQVLLGMLAGIPLFFGGLGSLFGGIVSRRLEVNRERTGHVRRGMATTGFFGAGILLVLSTVFENPLYAMLAMGASSFANDLAMPPSWAACMDVGGKFAGSLSGSMNMMGNLGGVSAPLGLAYILDHTNGNWNVSFWVSGAVYLVGGVCWFFIDPVTPLDREAETAPATTP